MSFANRSVAGHVTPAWRAAYVGGIQKVLPGAKVEVHTREEHQGTFTSYAPTVLAHTRVTGIELSSLRRFWVLLVGDTCGQQQLV
jgi:hypothetical protein